jgi:hypothetical protein
MSTARTRFPRVKHFVQLAFLLRNSGGHTQPQEVPMNEMSSPPRPAFEATFVPAREAPWWRNASTLIAALAFLLSLSTSLISSYTAHRKDVHDQQAQLTSVIEKLQQIPIARQSAPRSPAVDAAFVEQTRMLTKAARDLAERLGRNAPAPELMTVAFSLVGFEDYTAAKRAYRQAVAVADNFSDEVSALRSYGVTMIRYAHTDEERAEGERAFEQAMNIGTKYPDIAANPAEISAAHALTQLAWMDVWSDFDCTKALFHLQQADRFIASAATGPGWSDPRFKSQAWHEALSHCDATGRLPFRYRPGIEPPALPDDAPETARSPAPDHESTRG